ncbi:MAG: Gmad2 immunoglobulin-like domain-containing protein [Patescibacteria group bacterium]
MKKVLTAIAVIAILLGLAIYIIPKKTSLNDDKNNLIVVDRPKTGEMAVSPLSISGKARGYWYFEASFPVRLLDGNGKLLALKPAQAEDNWMTEEFVPFSVTLEFEKPETETGTLILQKDNPSGLPEHDDELRIPVRFR